MITILRSPRKARRFWRNYKSPNQITRTTAPYLRYLKNEHKTKMICDACVSEYPGSILFIPDELKREDYYLERMLWGADIFSYLPATEKTEKMCLAAVRMKADNLSFVPYKLITTEMCDIAVSYNIKALAYVPDDYLTEGLVAKAIKQQPEIIFALPRRFMTKELLMLAVNEDGFLVNRIDELMLDTELCITAMQRIADDLGMSQFLVFPTKEERDFNLSRKGIADFMYGSYKGNPEGYTDFFAAMNTLHRLGFVSTHFIEYMRMIDHSAFMENHA